MTRVTATRRSRSAPENTPVTAGKEDPEQRELVNTEPGCGASDEPGSHSSDDVPIHKRDTLLVGAVRSLEAAVAAGYGSTYAGTTVCGLADDTNKGTCRNYANL